jgi:hypothetical protein
MSRGSSMDRDETMSQGSGRGMAGRGEGGTRVLRIKRLVRLFVPFLFAHIFRFSSSTKKADALNHHPFTL